MNRHNGVDTEWLDHLARYGVRWTPVRHHYHVTNVAAPHNPTPPRLTSISNQQDEDIAQLLAVVGMVVVAIAAIIMPLLLLAL